jgi:RNA polymerase sigma factor (sigma-70 family)
VTDPIPAQDLRSPHTRAIPEEANRFFHDLYSKVVAYLRGMGCDPDLADEITNDACKIVADRWGRLRSTPAYADKLPSAYLYETARRLFWRIGKREAARLSKMTGIDAIGPEKLPTATTSAVFPISDELSAVLDQLLPKHREALLLRLVAGFNTAETAQVMGTNEGNVKYWLHQARKQAQELMRAAAHGELQGTNEEATR